MSKRQKQPINQQERIEITRARKPKKKTVHADPFARIKLHPLEELEARDVLTIEESSMSSPASLFDSDPVQVEPSGTNQVGPSTTTTIQDQVEPCTTNPSQVEPSRTKLNQFKPSKTEIKRIETSPSKNFTKVPNSIAKLAIPEKYFRGMSKHTYDILYQQTRGAVTPTRKIQLTKSDLVKLTGLAIHTVKLHIKYLNESGLIVTHRQIGQHTGSIYEVLVPEEIEYDQVEPSTTKDNQNLVSHTDHNVALLGHTKTDENKQLNTTSKTLLNTIRQIDDETAVIRAFEKLDEAARAATGSGLTKSDLEAFESIINLLIDVTTIAATRTESVTTYLKFAEANLKKRLSNPRRIFEKKLTKPFESGSLSTEETQLETELIFEPEPLTEEQRENALVIYRPLFVEKGIEALENARWQFTTEDYEWLVEKLANN
jgi:hypothetical protein